MYQTILKRTLQLIIVLFGISFISFSLLHIASGDPAYIKLSEMGIPPTTEILEQTRDKMGLDQPFIEQYLSWLGNALTGSFGESYKTGNPALEEFYKCLPNTLYLTFFAFLVCIFLSLPLGILSAVKQNKLTDLLIRVGSVVTLSIPDFYLALIFLFVFGLRLKILPIMGSGDIKHMIMPAAVLGIVSSGKLIRQIRAAVLEELSKDYVKGVRALGLPERIVLIHVLRNAMLSIFTIMGLAFGMLLGGASAIELLFNYRGISSQVVSSIHYRDLPMIQLYTLWMAGVFTLINFFVDISYTLFNPKLRIRN